MGSTKLDLMLGSRFPKLFDLLYYFQFHPVLIPCFNCFMTFLYSLNHQMFDSFWNPRSSVIFSLSLGWTATSTTQQPGDGTYPRVSSTDCNWSEESGIGGWSSCAGHLWWCWKRCNRFQHIVTPMCSLGGLRHHYQLFFCELEILCMPKKSGWMKCQLMRDNIIKTIKPVFLKVCFRLDDFFSLSEWLWTGPQVSALKAGVDLLCATPGRLRDFMTGDKTKDGMDGGWWTTDKAQGWWLGWRGELLLLLVLLLLVLLLWWRWRWRWRWWWWWWLWWRYELWTPMTFSFSRFFIAFGEHFLFSMSPEVVHLQNQQDSEFYIYCIYLYII